MGRRAFWTLSAMLLVLGPGIGHADSLKAAIGQKGAWTTSMVDYGLKQGFFKKEGLDVQAYYTSGGAPTLQAVISGSANIAIDTGLLGVIGAYVKGAPIRVISANSTGAPDIYWYAKASSGIKSLKDAAGKTVAFSEPGSSSNLILLGLLQQAHVTAKPTATGGIPATFTQVMSGQIDVGWAVPPFGLKEISEGKTVIVARGNDVPAFRNETVRVNVVNLNTLQNDKADLTKFMKAYARTIDWAYSSPQAIEYFAEANHVSKEIAQKARDEFFPRQQMELSEVKGLDLVLQQAYEFKYIPRPMKPADIKGLFDIVYKPQGR